MKMVYLRNGQVLLKNGRGFSRNMLHTRKEKHVEKNGVFNKLFVSNRFHWVMPLKGHVIGKLD